MRELFILCVASIIWLTGCVPSVDKAAVYQPNQDDRWSKATAEAEIKTDLIKRQHAEYEASANKLKAILGTPGKYPTAQDLNDYEKKSTAFLGAQRTARLMATVSFVVEKKMINEYVEMNKTRLLNGGWPEVQAELNQMYKSGEISASTFKKLSDAIEPIGKRGAQTPAPESGAVEERKYNSEISI